MDLGENFGSGAVVVVTLEQQLSGLLVQRRLRIGDDQETLDGEQNVLQTLKKSQHMLEAFGIYTDGISLILSLRYEKYFLELSIRSNYCGYFTLHVHAQLQNSQLEIT